MLRELEKGLPSPKRNSDSVMDRWYPYYAGYSSSFVRHVLQAITDPEDRVLDPWNGAGTTTLVAASLGRRATGFDLNPAMATIARARLLPRTVRASLLPLAQEITSSAESVDQLQEADGDPLSKWFRKPAAATIRSYERRIATLFDGRGSPTSEAAPATVLAAFFTMALFSATRELLAGFRASNPTWLKYPATPRHRINPTTERIEQAFRVAVQSFSDRLPLVVASDAELSDISTADAVDLAQHRGKFDACLTSPPYFTRVDYVRATLAELAVLGIGGQSVDELRRRSTGTPVVRDAARSKDEYDSPTGRALAAAIRDHATKGSFNYYGPWASRYFTALDRSVDGISKAVRTGGPVAIVVQDSHYKDLHVDLQRIVIEMFEARDRTLQKQVDFTPTHVRAWMHPASPKHRPSVWTTTESLLLFC